MWYTKPAVTNHAEREPTANVNLSNHINYAAKHTETFKIRSKDTANEDVDKSAEITFIRVEILETNAFDRLLLDILLYM